ncbi:MAG TPA: hypothetical protein VEV84_03485 [Pyrinomonadaceae bacterium]|nr:hypothetical protein [Pyrinomonadaceae bacterium]
MQELPFLMTYQIVGGPASTGGIPIGLSFPDGSTVGVSTPTGDPDAMAVTSWLQNSLAKSFVRRDGQLNYHALLECSSQHLPQFLRHACNTHATYPHAVFTFRARTDGTSRATSIQTDPSFMSTNLQHEAGLLSPANSFQLALDDFRVENAVQTSSGKGRLDWIYIFGHNGALSGSVPPDLRAAWNRNL